MNVLHWFQHHNQYRNCFIQKKNDFISIRDALDVRYDQVLGKSKSTC